jgi:hypothetical protein
MKPLDPAVTAHLAAGNASKRDMILFDLPAPTGLRGFWTGVGQLVFNGVTYVGAGSLIQIAGLNQQGGTASIPVIVGLRSVPDTELTPDTLATVENEQYHQRLATIFSAWLDPDTGEVVDVRQEYRGYIDQVVHKDQEGGQTTLLAYLESKARDHKKTLGRVRGDADQRRIAANDGALRHAATAATLEINWGRAGAQPPAPAPAAPILPW